MQRKAFSKGRTIVLVGLAAAAAVGAGALRSDLLLARGFGKAFQNSAPALSFDTAAHKDGAAQTATSGDEGYWLTRAEVESPSPFAKPLAVGDRITISGQDGRERRLEVMDLKSIGDNATRGAQLRLMLVTCRVADAGGSEATVRFIVEAEPSVPHPLPPQPAKAL
jgi:hypothetical protein